MWGIGNLASSIASQGQGLLERLDDAIEQQVDDDGEDEEQDVGNIDSNEDAESEEDGEESGLEEKNRGLVRGLGSLIGGLISTEDGGDDEYRDEDEEEEGGDQDQGNEFDDAGKGELHDADDTSALSEDPRELKDNPPGHTEESTAEGGGAAGSEDVAVLTHEVAKLRAALGNKTSELDKLKKVKREMEDARKTAAREAEAALSKALSDKGQQHAETMEAYQTQVALFALLCFACSGGGNMLSI